MIEPIGIDTVADTELFEFLAFEPNVSCSYDGCTNEAVNMLQCSEKDGNETICVLHTVQIAIIQSIDPESTIHFNETCGHQPKLSDCQIIPLVL